MGKFELWAWDKKEIFWDVMDEMQNSMEKFEDPALVEAEVTVFYKYEEGGNFKSIMDIKFPNDLVTCASLFYETDLISKWLESDFMKDIKINIHESPKRSIGVYSV